MVTVTGSVGAWSGGGGGVDGGAQVFRALEATVCDTVVVGVCPNPQTVHHQE